MRACVAILIAAMGSVGHAGDSAFDGAPAWDFPCQTTSAWYLGNAQAAWAVSKVTGQVLGGWNAKTRERYLVSMEGRYHLEDRSSLVTGRESGDSVQEAVLDGDDQRLELTCSNPDVPDLVIRKRYWVDGNKLFQRTAFTTRSSALQFITYNSQATFVQAYRDAGYYMGGGDGGWPLIPVPSISSWQKVTSYRNTTKGMVLHQPEKGYSFAHVRTRLDDQFVWPWYTGAIATYCERKNILHYTPDGWDMSLGTSRLSQTEETSFEQYVTVFEGDWQRFLNEEYPALPAVQKAYKEIPPTPDWVADIKISAACDLDRLRRMVEMTDEGIILSLVDTGGSWADYYVDQGIEGGLGGRITGEELRDLIQRIKALSPRIKVGIYMWNLSTVANARIYQKHPEWFRSTNKDGDPVSTFPGTAFNYAQLLSIPGCYDELLSQFDLVLGYLGTDFIYLDDPKAINPIDWDSGEYTRDDLSFKFFLDIKRIAAKHGPDKMVFFNNMCNPYADINFIEARGELGASFWRHFAGNAVIAETQLNQQPNARIVPLYYIRPHEREYMNHVLELGWIPSLVYGDVLARRAFIQAAYEVGNCTTVPARYSPDWKHDKQTNIESYAAQRNGDAGYLLSFVSHEGATRTVSADIELDSLALDRQGRVFVWEYVVENANTFKGVATERQVRNRYGETGERIDGVTRRRLAYAGPYRPKVQVDLEMEPLRLHQLYVTSQPVGVYSENGLPANYLFGKMPRVQLRIRTDWKRGLIDVGIESDRDEAEIVAFIPAAGRRLAHAMIDGTPVTPEWVREGDAVLPVIAVGKGSHALELTFAAGADTSPVVVRNIGGATDGAAVPTLGLGDQPPPLMLPGTRELVMVGREIRGVNVLRSAVLMTPTLRGHKQPALEALMARVEPDALLLEAGTTRKIDNDVRGSAFAGFEIENLRKIQVRLSNTFHDAHHSRGKGFHVPHRRNSGNFAGLVVDYHTSAGYTKRVRLAAGVMYPKCSSVDPNYGKPGLADEAYDLGAALIEVPETPFALDLRRYAPEGWDGQVWLSVGSDWIASDRRLKLEILAVNDGVSGPLLGGRDPKAYKEAYDKPKTFCVPRSPGGILIDGQPGEEWWKGAGRSDRFFLQGGLGVSAADTTAMLLYDDANLYVAFICMEPARRKPLILGGAAWDDDEVEIWIDANGDGQTHSQVIVNAANEKLEYTEKGPTPLGATSAVHVDEGTSWMVEMIIPFSGLGLEPPKPGDTWRLSLCRYRPQGKNMNSELIVWAPLQAGGFKDLDNFGTLVFE